MFAPPETPLSRPQLGPCLARGGFTLVEALVALAVVSVAVVMMAALVGNEPRMLRRLEAHRQAWEVLETVLEGIRAGQVTERSGLIDPAPWISSDPVTEVIEVEIEEHATARTDLVRLVLTARYRVAGRSYQRSVETLRWEPPSP